jgi:hypothetical protein
MDYDSLDLDREHGASQILHCSVRNSDYRAQGLAVNPNMQYTMMINPRTKTTYIFAQDRHDTLKGILSELELEDSHTSTGTNHYFLNENPL